MALRASIDLNTPDRIILGSDTGQSPVANFQRIPDTSPPEYEAIYGGVHRIKKKITTKIWYACTLVACNAAYDAYNGPGAVLIEEQSKVLQAYDFKIIEEKMTVEFMPREDEDEGEG